MQRPARPAIQPVDVVMSVFTTRRDLLGTVQDVLGDSGLSVEEADILVLLHGAAKLGWEEDFAVDADGYVTFRDLQAALVHEPSGFSRRVKPLEKRGLVETDVVRDRRTGLHGNSRRVRITRKGVASVRPLFARYVSGCDGLLKGLGPKDLQACFKVLEHVGKRCRERAAQRLPH